MGKIRVKTLGIDEIEEQEKKDAKKRAEAKKAYKGDSDQAQKQEAAPKETSEKSAEAGAETTTEETKAKPVKKEQVKTSQQKHSSKYLAIAAKVDRNKKYSLKEALELLPAIHLAKFDETVEVHLNTTDKGVSGSVVLPHGTGKTMKIAIADATNDAKGLEELIKKIEEGNIDFNILIATPESMPKLARVAKYLGPRGLMPNPKSGTITPKPQDAIKQFEGGQMNFKTESKFPIIHLSVGKLSFGDKKLEDNVKAAISAVQSKNIKEATLKSTMSPGIKLDLSSL